MAAQIPKTIFITVLILSFGLPASGVGSARRRQVGSKNGGLNVAPTTEQLIKPG
jgi:hypothetical protein